MKLRIKTTASSAVLYFYVISVTASLKNSMLQTHYVNKQKLVTGDVTAAFSSDNRRAIFSTFNNLFLLILAFASTINPKMFLRRFLFYFSMEFQGDFILKDLIKLVHW